jgi:threonylcarbamoyladenosine tRNA methylthiotransferase CDKAL1
MKIYLEAYGCTANHSDQRTIQGLIITHHHTITTTITDADLLILLTCTVIDRTEQRMLSRIRLFSKTNKPLIITGCMAAVQPDLIHTIAPHARLLPPTHLYALPDLINNHPPTTPPTDRTRLPKTHTGIIAPLSIAEGCDYACAYCITHHARGPLHSYPPNEITTDVTNALQAGCHEIQLTAQDTASYGRDINTNLDTLLTTLNNIPGDFYLRVGMMNPASLTPRLTPIINAFQHNTKVYKFLHLPLQSGDNDILTQMNRPYTTTDFHHCITEFRTAIPTITIATDVITGYPGETHHQAQTTLDFIETIKPDIVNVTRYSARPHTTAKTLPHRLTTQIMKERSRILAEQALRLAREQNQHYIGTHTPILLTEHGKNHTIIGRTPTYKLVIIPDNHQPLGSTIHVEIIDATSTSLFGKLK